MARLHLPEKMQTLRGRLGTIVEGIERRAPYGAALLSSRQGLQIYVDSREERLTEPPPTAGAVLTAFDGATLHEQAVGGFDPAEVERGTKDLLLRAGRANGHRVDPGPERRGDFLTEMKIPPESLTSEEKLDRCRSLRDRVQKLDPRIVNAQVNYLEASEYSVFANRVADLAQRVQRLRILLMVVVNGEQGVRYNWMTKGACGGWEALEFSDDDLESLVRNAVALLTAERIEPGEYTIVTAPGVTGTICHESFGHGVETDMFLKKRARAAQFVDKVVGSPMVNIYDDPSYPGGYAGYFFDDEGMPASPTQIVERGIFRRGITDLYSAAALGLPRSANGRRQDYTRKAYARMTNTFFGPGSQRPEDLFAQVDRGIYLEKWYSGMEDPQGWGIQVTCHFGREIKNGKVTDRMFSPVAITGYVPDVLQSIRGVAKDLALDSGTCGKGHKEYVPSASGGPHLLLTARLG
jgi:TldD protein